MRHVQLVAVLLFGAATLCAQGTPSAASNSAAPTAPSNWRDVPVKANAHPDTATAADRQARTAFWARFSRWNGPVGAVVDPRLPEIRQIPGSFWGIATFVNYDVYDIADNFADMEIYTEVHFLVNQIVSTAADATPQVGTMIDSDLLGGTVQETSGQILKRLGPKAEWPSALNPGGRYLIQFVLISPGNFYGIGDFYDLSTGVARPASLRVRWFAQQGKSHVDGLSEADAVAYIQQAFSPRQK